MGHVQVIVGLVLSLLLLLWIERILTEGNDSGIDPLIKAIAKP